MAQLLGGYHFKKVQILRDQELGRGSYGMVCKALCDELLCAAKLLHPVLVSERYNQKFHQECMVMSALKHPNIIQYLGIHSDGPSCQILLMELMEQSLTTFLEKSTPPLPFHTQVNLCHDICLALAYLHSNDIIHRDLSSNNVLLTGDKRAKVTDFGMFKLMDDKHLSTLTSAPGCPFYMSPEALQHTPKYSNKLDIFSFGVLVIQILTCKFPSPGSPRKKIVDQRYPVPIEVPVLETERRKADIGQIDPAHPLLKHALVCLSYKEQDRPTAQDMCHYMLELQRSDRYVSVKSAAEKTLERLQSQLKVKEDELNKKSEVITKQNEMISKQNEEIDSMRKLLSSYEEFAEIEL